MRAYTLARVQAGTSDQNAAGTRAQRGSWLFEVQIRNRKAAIGPLKYCSRDLEHYQQQYAYLLNWAKSDFTLRYNDRIYHPSSYVYTTHYSAFPLEQMLIGFEDLPVHPKRALTLSYIDRLFLHDTLQYDLNPLAVRREYRQHLTSDLRP